MKNNYHWGYLRRWFVAIVTLGVILNFIPITTFSACVELDAQHSIADMTKTASKVFQGTVREMALPEMVIEVAQYFKGNGPSAVTVTEVNGNCERLITADQTAIFFIKVNTNQSTPTAITNQELISIQPVSPEIIAEITSAVDCMATYHSELGKVHIPCLAVNQGSGGIYTVDLSLTSSSEPLELTVDSAQRQQPVTATLQPAHITQLDIQVEQSLPMQVQALVKGELADTCQKIAPIQVTRQDNVFNIPITTLVNLPPPGLDCTPMLIPFEEAIPLDIVGLADGIYTVNVNGMSDTFELAQDNIPFRALIEQVDVQVLESFPVQVNVKVKGQFSNGCQQIDQIEVTRTDNTFMVTMTTTPPPPPEIACTEALVPFEKTIELDVRGLKKGFYTANVNGIHKQFELAEDNVVVDN